MAKIISVIVVALIQISWLGRSTCSANSAHNNRRIGLISQQKCLEYQTICSSGRHLINDFEYTSDAAQGEFPFMAHIRLHGGWTDGILISEKFVVTLANYYDIEAVILGTVHSNKTDDNYRSYGVAETIIHPEYNETNFHNRIALLRLEESVKFSEFIQPACLPKFDSQTPTKLLQTGFGSTAMSDRNFRLRKVRLVLIPNDVCLKESQGEEYTEGLLDGTNICAAVTAGSRRLCNGLSGSALLNANTRMNCLYEAIGIDSVGYSCRTLSKPDFFVRLSSYLEWIETNVWPNETEATSTQTTVT